MTRRPRLGQHFLVDPAYRRRIAESLELRGGDWVLEIGAGQGEMTELLARSAGRVIAVELDPGLIEKLRERFKQDARVEIIRGDILAVEISALASRSPNRTCFVFGNLPYYVTSPILRHLLDGRESIRGMGLVMQREVAERAVAAPGGRDYGVLSVAVQLFTRPRILFDVPPGAFSPRPKVVSSLVEFRMEPQFPSWPQERTVRFLDFVKQGFAHKRKKLVNNLAATIPGARVEAALRGLRLPAAVRAEQLSIPQFAGLFAQLEGS